MTNPLLVEDGLPRFGEILPEHVVPAVRQVVQEALSRLAVIERELTPTWAGSMSRIEELERPFEQAWKPVGHLFGVKNSPALREAYDAVLPEIVQFSLRVRQSEPLYRALLGIRDGAEWATLEETRRRIVLDRIKDAELAGIGLPAEQRARFNEIEQQLSQLSTQYSNHVLDATKAFALEITDPADVEGWPLTLRQLAAQSYQTAHAADVASAGAEQSPTVSQSNSGETPAAVTATPEQGPWRITLETPLYVPFMEHCRNRQLRERLYRAFITRAASAPHDNTPLMLEILRLRREKARLLGYPHFAAVSLMRKMAPSVEAILALSQQLRDASWAPAQQDLADLVAFKERRGDTTPLALWDVPFWAERLREDRYAYTDEEIRPYFPFERVLEGLFSLLGRLFGITVRPVTDGVSLWHPDVRYYEIDDEQGVHIASFFLDPFSRPENKRGGAWMDDCLGRRVVNGRRQRPVAHLVCNQTPPVGDTPALMTFREVQTLFHEMGHGLQHMLTVIDHPDASGINGVEWDAVELPSQFLENWCYHRPTLLGITGHYQTGAPLPEALFEKLCAARNYRVASQMLRQLLFGKVDLALHTNFDPDGPLSPADVQRQVSEDTTVLPLLPEDRFLCSFQHIFSGGYAAGYYSYKWAEILSADAFSAFEDAGLDNPVAVEQTGRRFRETVLALGGSQHPLTIFRSFRGRDPDVQPLLRHCGLVPSTTGGAAS